MLHHFEATYLFIYFYSNDTTLRNSYSVWSSISHSCQGSSRLTDKNMKFRDGDGEGEIHPHPIIMRTIQLQAYINFFELA